MNEAPLRRKGQQNSAASTVNYIDAGLLTASAAADLLGLDARTLNNWRYRGIGPVFIRLGGKVRYSVIDLNAYVANSRQQITGRASYRLAS